MLPHDEVMLSAREWAEDLCKVAPPAVRAIKEAVVKSAVMSMEEPLCTES
jgi:hypothetical protein